MLVIQKTIIINPSFNDCLCGHAVKHMCELYDKDSTASVHCDHCGLLMEKMIQFSDPTNDECRYNEAETLYLKLCDNWNSSMSISPTEVCMNSDALNDAGWEFIDKHEEYIGTVSPILVNNIKRILQKTITKYIESNRAGNDTGTLT